MNPTSPETLEVTLARRQAESARLASELETRWPSVNLAEQRLLYARIEALRANLLKSRSHAEEEAPAAG